MRTKLGGLLGVLLLGASLGAAADSFNLAFGSCLRQFDPQPVWSAILASKPDVFVFGGDNVYTDQGKYLLRREPARIGRAYAELAQQPGFAALRASVPVYATWDDHDYGANDAGAEYPHKEASRQFFMDFFAVPADSAMRERAGVYDAHWLEHQGQRIQLILLDTRSFRSMLVPAAPNAACPRKRWGSNEAADATLLGTEQWTWLAARLAQPAALHLVVSSIQVIPEQHCYEKWANFPRERQRLLALLADAGAPVLILSGDRHLGEISRISPPGGGHPLLELTSSGMNSARGIEGEPNRHRALPDNVRQDNFATVELQWRNDELLATLSIRGTDARVLQRIEIAYPRS